MSQKDKKTNNKRTNIFVVCIILVIICLCFAVFKISSAKSGSTSSDKNTSQNSGVPDVSDSSGETEVLDTSLTYYAKIDIKDYGTITVKLEPSAAPVTCANFVDLANKGFYNGLTFHRIMEGFMMQGGAPKNSTDSAKTIVGEFSENGYSNNLSHTRGAISMARANDFNSASSQFFIVHKDSTFLDGQYAAFGYVTDGIEVVDKVCESSKPIDSNGTIPSSKQPIINSVSIITE